MLVRLLICSAVCRSMLQTFFRYRFVVCHSGFCFFVFLIFSGWGMSMVVRLFNFKISCNVLAGAIEFLMLVCFFRCYDMFGLMIVPVSVTKLIF